MEDVAKITSKRNKAAGNTGETWGDLAVTWGLFAAQAAASGALFSLGGLAVNTMLGSSSVTPAIGNDDVIQLPVKRTGNA